jgi:hypothetical protein
MAPSAPALGLIAAAAAVVGGHAASTPPPPLPPPRVPLRTPHGSPWAPSFTAAAAAKLATMDTEAKLTMVRGNALAGLYVGNVLGNASLGIPPLALEDGPQGVADNNLFVTQWPSALTVTMSWDVGMMRAFGLGMAEEQHAKGTNVHLAPAVNLARVPWGGRNWEYMGACRGRAGGWGGEAEGGGRGGCFLATTHLRPAPTHPSQARTPTWPLPWWRPPWRASRARTCPP